MKAVVVHAVGDIRVEEVPRPRLQKPTDAIVALTSSAICGTDLHFVRGTTYTQCTEVNPNGPEREAGWMKVELASAA